MLEFFSNRIKLDVTFCRTTYFGTSFESFSRFIFDKYLIRTNFANLEHEYFASINFRDFAKNDKFRAFNFAKIDKRQT